MFDRFCPVFVFVFAFVLPGPGLISAGKRSVEIEDDDVTALHPNLKMVGHDKAHSFRRSWRDRMPQMPSWSGWCRTIAWEKTAWFRWSATAQTSGVGSNTVSKHSRPAKALKALGTESGTWRQQSTGSNLFQRHWAECCSTCQLFWWRARRWPKKGRKTRQGSWRGSTLKTWLRSSWCNWHCWQMLEMRDCCW